MDDENRWLILIPTVAAISEAGETQESVARGASIHGGPMVTEARQGRPSSRGRRLDRK